LGCGELAGLQEGSIEFDGAVPDMLKAQAVPRGVASTSRMPQAKGMTSRRHVPHIRISLLLVRQLMQEVEQTIRSSVRRGNEPADGGIQCDPKKFESAL
jgi:hypothetical protein